MSPQQSEHPPLVMRDEWQVLFQAPPSVLPVSQHARGDAVGHERPHVAERGRSLFGVMATNYGPGDRPRPLRVVMGINSMMTGGSELHAVRLSEGLRARGHEVYCATLTANEEAFSRRYEDAGVTLLRFPLPRLAGVNGVTGAVGQVRQAAQQFRDLRIDVVHAHDFYMNIFLGVAGRLAGVPSVASKRWAFHERRKHRLSDFVAFRLVSRVLANSPWVARSLVETDGVDASRVVTVGNFVNAAVFAARGGRPAWRQRFGFGPDEFVLGITARLRAEKNHPLLLEALASLYPAHPRLRLLIVGDGPERAALEELVRARGLSAVVHFAGHLEDAWRATAAMDLFVLPSKHEGFPNALLEAMAIGVPVLASAVGGIPDVVTHGSTGMLIDRLSPTSLAHDIARALQDTSALAGMSATARRLVLEHHSEERILDLHEHLYSDLLGFPRATG